MITKLTSCIGDQAQCWKIINNLSGAANRKSVDKIKLDNGEVVSDARQVAESINSYLISTQGPTHLHTSAPQTFLSLPSPHC
ncbi:hypothetical protein J6590_104201 [Homalodisca vitripennis]|nr:hypothetical protein J6590_104201 [Homalodisca vitripennis]